MAKDWQEELISAIQDLDNFVFNEEPCTVIFYCGYGDRGRYVDATILNGHQVTHNLMSLADVIGADDLPSAIKELAEQAN